MPQNLPRGIYYEEKKRRFRVRLYRNNSTFVGGYFPTSELALAAWVALKAKLDAIPKLKRNQKETRRTFLPSIAGIFHTIREDLLRAPGSKRVAKK